MRIASNPEHVCFEHALEFWTGLLIYAREGANAFVKHEQSGRWSEQQLSASDLRAAAIAAAGPPPRSHERVQMRLAS
jgi:hypothetical protein